MKLLTITTIAFALLGCSPSPDSEEPDEASDSALQGTPGDAADGMSEKERAKYRLRLPTSIHAAYTSDDPVTQPELREIALSDPRLRCLQQDKSKVERGFEWKVSYVMKDLYEDLNKLKRSKTLLVLQSGPNARGERTMRFRAGPNATTEDIMTCDFWSTALTCNNVGETGPSLAQCGLTPP